MNRRGIGVTLLLLFLAVNGARAENDLEDLVLLTQDPGINGALQKIGKVPLSTNTIGYDPCDDPTPDPARKTGCVANDKVEHVVYIILENHTFDNYYAHINKGKTRVKMPDVATEENDVPQPLSPDSSGNARAAGDYRFPTTRFHLTEYCGWSDLGHSWGAIHHQVHQNKLDGYLTGNSTNAPAMGHFEYEDLAYYYELVSRFAIADRFFTSAATQSWPNHYYTVSGTSQGYINNDIPVVQDDASRLAPKVEGSTATLGETGHTWRAIFDSLEEGGISWKIYMTNIAIPMAFSNFKKWAATGHVAPIAQYYEDLAAGTLPQVAYLAPGINVSDEHPSSGNHQRGQLQVSTLVNSLMASTAWRKSVMFITYDDSGGWYDHVPSPRAYQPNDHCDESLWKNDNNCVNGTWVPGSKAGHASALASDDLAGDSFDLLGARLPFTLLSPWLKTATDSGGNRIGYVSHRVYETATILSFIEWRFGLPSLNNRTRAYKDGWRNPGCDWDLAKLATDSASGAPEEIRALAWSAGLNDPFRTVRCEPCSSVAEQAKDQRNYCAEPAPNAGEGNRAKGLNGQPIQLAIAENRYLDPLLDPFDFARAKPGLLDGAKIAAELPPLSETDLEEVAGCPATGDMRSPLAPAEH